MKKSGFLALAFLMLFVFTQAYAETRSIGAGVAIKTEYIHFTDSTIRRLNADDGIFVGIEAYKQLILPGLFLGIETGWAGTSGDVAFVGPGQIVRDPATNRFVRLPPSHISFDNELTYIPFEINAKYEMPLTSHLNFRFGAGASYNYFSMDTAAGFGSAIPVFGEFSPGGVTFKYSGEFFRRTSSQTIVGIRQSSIRISDDSSDWVFGGQFFAGLDYKFGRWFAGAEVKYQLTENLDLNMFGSPALTDSSADNLRAGLQIGYTF